MADNAHLDTDIAVVGGGLAGASLALAVAEAGLSVTLIEARPFAVPDEPAARERTTALSYGTRVLFERMGLWSTIQDFAAPIERLHVSQRRSFGRVAVDADEYGVPALGYVVANAAMIEALKARVEVTSAITMMAPATFESLEQIDGGVRLTLQGGDPNDPEPQTLTAGLVVGADGANSAVRHSLGIGAHHDDYDQRALVTTVEPEIDPSGTAYERFTPDGPIALLPRSESSCALVWTLPPERALELVSAETEEFEAALSSQFGSRLGKLQLAGPRGSYPLARTLCDRAVASRGVLIGNAGHALHPAAAQGFNLAVRDALTLAATLAEHQRLSSSTFDPGNADVLDAWAEARQPDQRRVANFTDTIVRTFSNRLPGLGGLRGAALFGLSMTPSIRHDIARRSMGLALAPALDDLLQETNHGL